MIINLVFFSEIATPACRNVTSACRHAPTGARNDRVEKGVHSLNQNLDQPVSLFFSIFLC
jgi:hypothetical protein